jgi:hypothetical protein
LNISCLSRKQRLSEILMIMAPHPPLSVAPDQDKKEQSSQI